MSGKTLKELCTKESSLLVFPDCLNTNNDRIEELKESIKETEEKKNDPPKLKVEDLNVGETQNKNSIEHSEHDL